MAKGNNSQKNEKKKPSAKQKSKTSNTNIGSSTGFSPQPEVIVKKVKNDK